MNGLFSPECVRTPQGGKGAAHGRCPGVNRLDGDDLGLVCLCACHTAADLPPQPSSYQRAQRMRADWQSGQFRQVDLARRYAVSMNDVRRVLYRHKREV